MFPRNQLWLCGVRNWKTALVMLLGYGAIVLEPTAALASNPIVVSQQVSWGNILSQLRRDKPPHGSRGELCLLVPSEGKPEILWRDRPLFVWQGLERTIGLRRAGSETVFWRRSLTQPGAVVNQMQFVGLALQPGQTYELLVFSSPTARQPVRWQPFTVMPNRDRTSMTAELQALTTQLKNEGATAEAIAQRRAQYFVDRQLQADAIQEAYSVSNPSIALQQLTTDIPERLCNSR